MEKRKWLYPETFNEKTLLHKNYHGKIKNNKYNNMKTNVLMPICVGLKLVLVDMFLSTNAKIGNS